MILIAILFLLLLTLAVFMLGFKVHSLVLRFANRKKMQGQYQSCRDCQYLQSEIKIDDTEEVENDDLVKENAMFDKLFNEVS